MAGRDLDCVLRSSWSRLEFALLADLVREHAGLVFGSARLGAVQDVFAQQAATHTAGCLGNYLQRVGDEPALMAELLTELTVGETYFFRHTDQFNALRTTILPVVRSKKMLGDQIRLWSAGCAGGEEPYTLAIVMAEMGLEHHCRIVGTDISLSALAKARSASYSGWSLRGVDEVARGAYFARCNKRWQLRERYRDMVALRRLNLASDDYPSLEQGIWEIDIAFCRNVLIYFDEPTIAKVAERIHASLGDEGWLVTAPADPPLQDYAPFEPVNAGDVMMYRRQARRSAASLTQSAAPSAHQRAIDASSGIRRKGSREDAPADAGPRSGLQTSLAELEAHMAAGEYEQALARISATPECQRAYAVRLRALSNLGRHDELARDLQVATQRYPLSAELRYLQAMALLTQGDTAGCTKALKRVLFLDGTLAMAHFTLAAVLKADGLVDGARRSLRNAIKLVERANPDDPVALGDGLRAGLLLARARSAMEAIDKVVA